jgi:hypothetical protein
VKCLRENSSLRGFREFGDGFFHKSLLLHVRL